MFKLAFDNCFCLSEFRCNEWNTNSTIELRRYSFEPIGEYISVPENCDMYLFFLAPTLVYKLANIYSGV